MANRMFLNRKEYNPWCKVIPRGARNDLYLKQRIKAGFINKWIYEKIQIVCLAYSGKGRVKW